MGLAKTNQYWPILKFQSCLFAKQKIWFNFMIDDLLK